MTIVLEPDTDLGQVIREQRERRGMTQAELGRAVARQVGRPRAYGHRAVGAWEHNRRQPDRQTLTGIGHALGVVFVLSMHAATGLAELQRQRRSRELEAGNASARAEDSPTSEREVP